MSKLANVLSGQTEKGLKLFANGGAVKPAQKRVTKAKAPAGKVLLDSDGDAMKCGGAVKGKKK